MNQTLEIIYQVCGGLGIFLLGMKNMSEGMQAVAGERLRKMIGAVTNNRILACGVGLLVTMIIQSSSVTTVMVVGLVNAGIMTLLQAIGVIMGANIGTTITGWILVINIGKYGLPMLGAASFFYLFSKRDRVRFTAMFLMGLGMVFFGLELMKNGFSPLKDMPGFISWFHRFQPDSYFGIWKCVLVGTLLTAVIQSSSATVGITLGLADIGIIGFPTAAALILGENIGTTVTALLASIGANSNARRAALAHSFFNLLGVCWITLIFPWYAGFIERIITIRNIGTVQAVVVTEKDDAVVYEYAQKARLPENALFKISSPSLDNPGQKELLPDKPFMMAADFKEAFEKRNLPEKPVYNKDRFVKYPFSQPAIALTHSLFNIINTLIFLPLAGLLARFLMWLVREEPAPEIPRLTYLNIRMLDTPAIGIQQSLKEVIRMGQTVIQMMNELEPMLSNQPPEEKKADEIFQKENDLDIIQMEIVQFLGDILSGNISHDVIDESRRQIRMADEFESVSDYIAAILKLRPGGLRETSHPSQEGGRLSSNGSDGSGRR
ncbi:MAG TPA: Na/Pi cotransporter family protein [Anaerohalosphaeraceae bacterium]|nr:Na/Pi cotransporter family protein [Anaerohalosphaeraceae bacterium]HOL88629.1 Na/Pi cotransporter family protein [Anaerohalosphaeraceae bacterium]HPP56223.1 Na/Pi cotransporter family protein [Anaerohalosphaeraceae bacterium]